MTPKLKKIITTLVVIGIVYFGYTNFVQRDSSNSGSLISGANGLSNQRNLAETQALGNQITQALIQIESLSLDRSIFENSIFKSLNDRSEPINSEPIGRTNPFAPLGQSNASSENETELDFDSGDDGEDVPAGTVEQPPFSGGAAPDNGGVSSDDPFLGF
jgi:hypothetical protein